MYIYKRRRDSVDFTYRDKKETSTHKLCFFPEGKVEFHISDLFSSSQPSLSMATSQQYNSEATKLIAISCHYPS